MSIRGMKPVLTLLVIWVAITVPAVTIRAETVTTPHRVESVWPTSAAIDLNSDGKIDLNYQGSGIYSTYDVPPSGAGAWITIQGTSDIEFFLSTPTENGIPTPLAVGTLLGPDTPGGYWVAGEDDHYVSVSASHNLTLGTTHFVPEPLPDDYFTRVGFRLLTDSSYHYGWIDLRVNSPLYTIEGREAGRNTNPRLVRTSYETVADQVVHVSALPEPNAIFMAVLATTMTLTLRRSRASRWSVK